MAGGSSLSGDWTGKRVQAWAQSQDGVHWQNEQVVLRADEKDPPTANIQFAFVMYYGGYYLGFLTLHDIRGQFRIQFAWSADGIHWQRTSREPWLDIGAKGAFDAGMVLGPTDPILWQDKMGFPYGGFPTTHDSPRQDWEAAVGMAMTRLDGFSCWHAEEDGELVTQPFVCRGDRLFINARAEEGTISVEVLDGRGKPVTQLDSKSCVTMSGDTLKGADAGWVQWKQSKSLSTLRGKQIQLRFNLHNARLFSFRIADDQTRELPTPRATDR